TSAATTAPSPWSRSAAATWPPTPHGLVKPAWTRCSCRPATSPPATACPAPRPLSSSTPVAASPRPPPGAHAKSTPSSPSRSLPDPSATEKGTTMITPIRENVYNIDYFDCTGKPDGNYRHPTDCTRYITCSGNQAADMACPPCGGDAHRCAGEDYLRWNQ